MDIKQALQEAKNRRQEVVNEINELTQDINQIEVRKQALLQEALRCDGEVRALERLSKDGKNEVPK